MNNIYNNYKYWDFNDCDKRLFAFINNCLEENITITEICKYLSDTYVIYHPEYIIDFIKKYRNDKQYLIDDYYKMQQLGELNLL
jgi:hypothetical protein